MAASSSQRPTFSKSFTNIYDSELISYHNSPEFTMDQVGNSTQNHVTLCGVTVLPIRKLTFVAYDPYGCERESILPSVLRSMNDILPRSKVRFLELCCLVEEKHKNYCIEILTKLKKKMRIEMKVYDLITCEIVLRAGLEFEICSEFMHNFCFELHSDRDKFMHNFEKELLKTKEKRLKDLKEAHRNTIDNHTQFVTILETASVNTFTFNLVGTNRERYLRKYLAVAEILRFNSNVERVVFNFYLPVLKLTKPFYPEKILKAYSKFKVIEINMNGDPSVIAKSAALIRGSDIKFECDKIIFNDKVLVTFANPSTLPKRDSRSFAEVASQSIKR